MKRIYSNYSDDEYRDIEAAAGKAGMTASAYCKYAVLDKVHGRSKKNSSTSLTTDMLIRLKNMKSQEVFIVSELFSKESWSALTRAEKLTLSKQLSRYVRENPEEFTVNATLPGKITQYKKQ